MWVRIPGKIRKTLDPKAKSGTITLFDVRKISRDFGGCEQGALSRHCQIIEDKFPIRAWKNISRISNEVGFVELVHVDDIESKSWNSSDEKENDSAVSEASIQRYGYKFV